MARPDAPPRRPVSGKAPRLAPAHQGPRPEPRPQRAPIKTRIRKREPESENDEPAPPPKRPRKFKKNAGAKRQPIVISDDEYEPVSPRKTGSRKVAEAGFPVGRSSFHVAEDEDEQIVEALEARRKEPLTMRLFYPETLSKQRHAKRIFGVRPLGHDNEKGPIEDGK